MKAKQLAALLKEAEDAIAWMSGSSDFAPEGQAHEGWIKTRPILDKLRDAAAILKDYDLVPKGGGQLAQWELRLAAQCLEWAADRFANHGCNDIEPKTWAGLTAADGAALLREMQEWNGDPHPAKLSQIQDWMLMNFYAAKFRKTALPPVPPSGATAEEKP